MKTTIFLFHPHLEQSRVNKALAQAAAALDNVEVRDMYALYPDGRIDVAAEQAVAEASDRLVFQFPFYWYSSPSLFKEWQDQVLAYGWAYGSQGTALHGKDFLLAVSPGAKASQYVHEANFKYAVTDLLRPFQATSNLIGTNYIKPFITAGAMSLTDQDLANQTVAYQAYLSQDSLASLGDYQ